jgi:hypothetical protein
VLVAFAVALLVGVTPPKDVDSLMGVWPNEAISDVVSQNGEPLLVRTLPDGQLLSWNRLPNPDAYMIILQRAGVVQSIRVFPTRQDGSKEGLTDSFGVTIGDSLAQLKAKRGNPARAYPLQGDVTSYRYALSRGGVWIYEFEGDALHAIQLISAQPSPAGPATGPDPRNGTSVDKAFILNARDEDEGVRFERFYASIEGGCATNWQLGKQTTFSQSGRQYDLLDMTCSSDNSAMTLYFDITSFFGKL